MANFHHAEPAPPPGTPVLVTGAAGFIGAHLAKRLAEAGCEVTVLVRPGSDLSRIASLLDDVHVVTADLGADAPPLPAARPRIVYHLAAAGVHPGSADAAQIVRVNTVGTLQMLELAQRAGTERFVYCGSCFEYGGGSELREDRLPGPLSEYGASKAAGWMLAQAFSRRHGLPVTSLRPFTVYGPLEPSWRLVPTVIRAALAGDAIELTAGEQRRDFVFVGDAVDAFVRASVAPAAAGGTFNVCTGSPVSVREVVSTIVELTGSASEPVYGARPYRQTDVPTLSGDPQAAKDALAWCAPTSLRAGLQATVRALAVPGALQEEVPAA